MHRRHSPAETHEKAHGTTRAQGSAREIPDMDLVYLIATIAFFVASIAYVRACDRL
jgi:hypothetical protein